MPTTYAVPNGRTAFNPVIWTGNGASSRAITGVGFQPDWVWDKMRSAGYQHAIVDSVRGGNQVLHSNSSSAEDTNWQYGYVSSFDSNGFTIQAGSTSAENWNLNAATFVAWCWKANGTAVTNTSGSISSQVSANTAAGFSVVTYTGNGTGGATVGHGLGVAPKMIIAKNRTSAGFNWPVYNSLIQSNYILLLNTTDAEFAFAAFPSAPTSSVFSIGSWGGINESATAMVAYCFAEVAGYSSFGKYTGNGSADGPFIYTGFKPAFVVVKRTDTTGDWPMVDATRDPYNVAQYGLYANSVISESSFGSPTPMYDFNSNGFKIRNTFANTNASGGTYIYMAFASNPFKYANAG